MVRQQPSPLPAPDGGADWVNLHVCRRMKTKRILLNMSQDRLAKALGISYHESGKSRLPSSMLYRAALALKTPIAYFFDSITPEGGNTAEDGLDKAALLAVRKIQNLTDGDMRRSLLRLIDDLAQSSHTDKLR
jgi:transcriptional regulator with XRE-family HTH domain